MDEQLMVFISILGLLYMQEKAATNNFIFLCKIYYLIIVGITFMQNYVIIGVRYKSPTLAFALANLIPAFTFLLGVIFRMEKLELKSSKSQIKVLGTLVSISEALVMTLYKGPPILSPPIQPHLHPSPSTMLTTSKNWLIDGLFIATASLSLLANIIGQALFGNVVTISVQAWCIWHKGPVFVATFKPLSIFVATFYIVSFLGFIFLGDDGEEGIGGRGGEGKGGEVCKKVKGLMIGGGMENGISVKSIMENNNSITDVTENG
ncbi:hypothetical protein GOBAR_DD22075 [Gossypium barbadense]|nr:hypothetical protein GOBAR_DD22075 [Gossypium barbadense]